MSSDAILFLVCVEVFSITPFVVGRIIRMLHENVVDRLIKHAKVSGLIALFRNRRDLLRHRHTCPLTEL
jgi:hypothetical protein